MHVFRIWYLYHYLILFSQKNYNKEAQIFIKIIQLQLRYFANQFQEIIGLMIENNVIITLRKGLRKFSILLFYLNHLSHIWFDAFVPLIYTLAYNSVLLWKIFKKNFSPNSDLIFLPVKCHSENWTTKPFLRFITVNTIIQIAKLSSTEILEKRRFLHDSWMAALSKSDWNSKCQNPPPFDYVTSNLVSEAAIQSRARRTVRRILENSVEKTYDSADF